MKFALGTAPDLDKEKQRDGNLGLGTNCLLHISSVAYGLAFHFAVNGGFFSASRIELNKLGVQE